MTRAASSGRRFRSSERARSVPVRVSTVHTAPSRRALRTLELKRTSLPARSIAPAIAVARVPIPPRTWAVPRL